MHARCKRRGGEGSGKLRGTGREGRRWRLRGQLVRWGNQTIRRFVKKGKKSQEKKKVAKMRGVGGGGYSDTKVKPLRISKNELPGKEGKGHGEKDRDLMESEACDAKGKAPPGATGKGRNQCQGRRTLRMRREKAAWDLIGEGGCEGDRSGSGPGPSDLPERGRKIRAR